MSKDPVLSEAGKRGALKRWGPPKTIRVADLTPDQRRLVNALVEAARATKPDAPAEQS